MIPIIATRSYELVRNRIAQILATELPNQATLHSDAGLNADVFIDRIVPLHDEEMPLINIVMGSGNWDNFTRFKQDGTYSYNVDIYTKSSGTSTEMGDVLSMNKLQKLAGVVQGILMHPQYITLSFAAPFIEHTEVNSITMGIPNNTLDASNVTQARLTFVVRVPETETSNTPLDIAGWSTQVKLGLTDKGYLYSGDAPIIPEPVCEVLTFVYNSANTLLVSKTVSDNDNAIVAPDITVTKPDGSTYTSPSGVDIVCPAGGGGTADVTNTSGSYNETVNAGDTLVVPDSAISVNGELIESLPATEGKDLEVINTLGESVGQLIEVCENNITTIDNEIFDASELTSVTDWQPSDINTTGLISSDGTGGVLIDSTDLSTTEINVSLPYMVVTGDSISMGAPTLYGRLLNTGANNLYDPNYLSQSGQINYQLSKLFNVPSINQGISGDTTTAVRNRWDRDVLAIPTAVGDSRPNTTLDFNGQKPRLVFLHCGINDSGISAIPSATTKANLQFFAQSCRDNNIQLVMSNIGALDGMNATRQAHTIDVNGWIDSTLKVSFPEITVIDYAGWSTNFTYDYTTTRAGMFADSVHPNITGYIAYSQYIYENCTPNIKLTNLNLSYILDPTTPYSNFNRITEFIFNQSYYNISGLTAGSIAISGLKTVDTPIYPMLITGVENVTNTGALTPSTGLSALTVDIADAGTCLNPEKKLLIADGEVTNSTESVSLFFNAEGKLILPDVKFTDSTGAVSYVPALTEIIATLCSVESIVLDDLSLWLNAGDTLSYSGSGSDWYDLTTPARDADLYGVDGSTFDPSYGGIIRFNSPATKYGIINSLTVDFTNPHTTQFILTLDNLSSVYANIMTLSSSYGQTFRISYGDGSNASYKGLMIGSYNAFTPLRMTNEALPINTPMLVTIEFTGGDSTLPANYNIEVNQVVLPTVASGGYGATEYVNNFGRFDGGLAQILHYTRLLTPAEKANNYNIWQPIYSLPI